MIAINSIIMVLIFEVIGLVTFDNDYYWNMRYLSLSKNAVVNNDVNIKGVGKKTFWTYAPNSDVRTVATYASFLGAWTEYDCRFETNQFGLIRTLDHIDRIDYLVLGDSFTEGQGGCPWLTQERLANSNIREIRMLNGGLQGSGLLTFEAVLRLVETLYKPKNLIIVAISNDFKRGGPNMWKIDECAREMDCDPGSFWHFIEQDASEKSILATTQKRRRIRNDAQLLAALKELTYYSLTVRTLRKIASIFKHTEYDSSSPENRFDANFKALSRIRDDYANLKIILVTQRDEVGLFGSRNSDTELVINRLTDMNADFSLCALDSNDFMPIDGHPNQKGYRKLFECLSARVLDNIL